MKLKLIVFVIASTLVAVGLFPVKTFGLTRSLIFPVIGPSSYSNDYEASRPSGPHHAIDVLAKKGQKLVAVVSGTITYVAYPQPNWGYMVSIRDSAGYRYNYLHINDDNPGTNDGRGGGMHAYAVDVWAGNPVVKGQLLGWVGDSGHSNGVSHLHFEAIKPNGDTFNPYSSLNDAKKISTPVSRPKLPNEILPFGPNSRTKPAIDMGSVDSEPNSELVVGAGPGSEPIVRIFNDYGPVMNSFRAYTATFKGGVDVAIGDVNGDGTGEIITVPGRGEGGGSHIKVFSRGGTKLADFRAFGGSFVGLRVAAGDVDDDGTDEIIVARRYGASPLVRVFELNGTQIANFLAFDSSFTGGLDVAAGDVTDTGAAEILAAPGSSAKPIKVWQLAGNKVGQFYPYGSNYDDGIRISVGDVRSGTLKEEILTVMSNKNGPRLKLYAYNGSSIGTGSDINSGVFMEAWWRGPYDVAAGLDVSKAATGDPKRRAAIKNGLE